MAQPSLDIVIVNWNSGAHLRRCLESIQAASRDGFHLNRVVVVDNASSDSSADGLDDLGLPCLQICNPLNRGFAAACNQGASESAAKYLLFLNPDVILLQESLAVPIGFMERPDSAPVGICGIQLLSDSGQIAPTCSFFPTPSDFFSKVFGLDLMFPNGFPGAFIPLERHEQSGYVDHVMGAFFLTRRTVFESLGGFDERFFVYFEDLDFSYRAFESGWRSYFLAKSKARHKGNACSERAGSARLFYSLRSRILYSFKHFRRPAAMAVLVATFVFEPFSRLVRAALCRSPGEMRHTLHAYWALWRSVPSLLPTKATGAQ